MLRISASILSADFARLADEIADAEAAGVDGLHVDVMDGCFCPLLTVGPPFIKAMKTPLLKDVHLMINDPVEKVAAYVEAGADIITFNPEDCVHPHRVLQALSKLTNVNDPERGLIRGVALNPGTPLEVLEPLLEETEFILLLAVNPGWRSQSFAGSTARRIEKVKKMIEDAGSEILLGVDGGITRSNVAEVARLGADIIVTGSAVFDGGSAEENAKFMLSVLPPRIPEIRGAHIQATGHVGKHYR